MVFGGRAFDGWELAVSFGGFFRRARAGFWCRRLLTNGRGIDAHVWSHPYCDGKPILSVQSGLIFGYFANLSLDDSVRIKRCGGLTRGHISPLLESVQVHVKTRLLACDKPSERCYQEHQGGEQQDHDKHQAKEGQHKKTRYPFHTVNIGHSTCTCFIMVKISQCFK